MGWIPWWCTCSPTSTPPLTSQRLWVSEQNHGLCRFVLLAACMGLSWSRNGATDQAPHPLAPTCTGVPSCAANVSQLRGRLTAERQLHALALLAAAAGLADEALTLWQVRGPQLEPPISPSRLGLQVSFLCVWSAYLSPRQTTIQCISRPFLTQNIGETGNGGVAAAAAAAAHSAALLSDDARTDDAQVLAFLPWLARAAPQEALSILQVCQSPRSYLQTG